MKSAGYSCFPLLRSRSSYPSPRFCGQGSSRMRYEPWPQDTSAALRLGQDGDHLEVDGRGDERAVAGAVPRSWTSPTRVSIVRPSQSARCWAASSNSGTKSLAVTSHHRRAAARVAAATGGDVEDPLAGAHVDGFAQQLSDDREPRRDLCEVPRGPHLLLALRDLSQVDRHGSFPSCSVGATVPAR